MINEKNKLEEPLLPKYLSEDEKFDDKISEGVKSNIDFFSKKIDSWEKFYNRVTQGSVSGSVICILCLTFGSGILTLPYSFKKVGVILGLILFIFASFSVFWTLRLITKVSFKMGSFSYSDLIYKLYGKNHVIVFDLMNLISNLGAIIVYQQIISNFFLSFINYCGITFIIEYPNLSRFIQMYSFTIFTQIPLSFVKNITVLQKFSVFGTLALFYMVIVAFVEFPFYFKANYSIEKINFFTFDFNVIKILCMFYFAFANHNAVLHVYNEVSESTKEKGNKIVKYSFIIELITYSTVILSGYFSTFDLTNEIFIDREGQSVFLVIGKALYSVSLTCNIGLFYFISRPSIEMLTVDGRKFSDKENCYIGIILLLVLNTIAYYFTSVSNVISIFGGSTDIYIIFIMPVMLYLAYKPKRDWKRYLSIFLMGFSVLIGMAFLVIAILENFVSIL